jgi:hypothetical protein
MGKGAMVAILDFVTSGRAVLSPKLKRADFSWRN